MHPSTHPFHRLERSKSHACMCIIERAAQREEEEEEEDATCRVFYVFDRPTIDVCFVVFVASQSSTVCFVCVARGMRFFFFLALFQSYVRK